LQRRLRKLLEATPAAVAPRSAFRPQQLHWLIPVALFILGIAFSVTSGGRPRYPRNGRGVSPVAGGRSGDTVDTPHAAARPDWAHRLSD